MSDGVIVEDAITWNRLDDWETDVKPERAHLGEWSATVWRDPRGGYAPYRAKLRRNDNDHRPTRSYRTREAARLTMGTWLRKAAEKMKDEKTQRAMMAADMAHRAGVLYSTGEAGLGGIAARAAGNICGVNSEAVYRGGLRRIGVTPEAIDAAVAAIRDGKHPADSLAGRVIQMHYEARREGSDRHLREMAPPPRTPRDIAVTLGTLDNVLDLLGAKPQ